MARAGDDPDASDPYFFDFGCRPTNFRSRRGGLSSNSEAASSLQHEMQKANVKKDFLLISQSRIYVIYIITYLLK